MQPLYEVRDTDRFGTMGHRILNMMLFLLILFSNLVGFS